MTILPRKITRVVTLVFGLGAAAIAAMAQNLDGRWTATTVQGGVTIPFRLAARGNSHYLRRRVALAALREFLELTGCHRADQAALQHKVSRVV
jgi:hypothetical protein